MSEWIEWKGGECPLLDGQKTVLMIRGGQEIETSFPNCYRWSHLDTGGDIIAYKVEKPAGSESDAKQMADWIEGVKRTFSSQAEDVVSFVKVDDPAPFDPTKLCKGDKIAVEFLVEEDGVDADGNVYASHPYKGNYLVCAGAVIGYAPGYTPQPETPSELDQAIQQANEAMNNLKRVIGGLK